MNSIKHIIYVIILIFLATTVSAISITTEPKELKFENVLPGGYAEQTFYIKTDDYSPIQFDISVPAFLEDWVILEPEAGQASKIPTEIKVKINSSPDAKLGIYEGYLIISTTSSGTGITTSIITAVDMKISISLTEERTEQVVVKDVFIEDIEQGNPIEIITTMQNQGNIELSPFFKTDILDESENIILSVQTPIRLILPYATEEFKANISNNLPVGKYWAHTAVFLGNNLLRNQMSSFWVARKGAIPSEEETETIKVYSSPVPLSTGWIVLVAWGLILVFVIWTIAKNRYKKK